MKKIIKNREPQAWTEYRLTPDADYKSIPELRDALLIEQGYICAYCTRRIPSRDKNSSEHSRIDHIQSRDKHDDLKLSYNNMVICCPGAINDNFHCDKSKKNDDITFNLFADHTFTTLSYSTKDGEIKSTNDSYKNEINQILNLNNKLLKKNRIFTIEGFIEKLGKKDDWNTPTLTKILEEWNSKDSDGKFKPYCGIVIWFLQKKLRGNYE